MTILLYSCNSLIVALKKCYNLTTINYSTFICKNMLSIAIIMSSTRIAIGTLNQYDVLLSLKYSYFLFYKKSQSELLIMMSDAYNLFFLHHIWKLYKVKKYHSQPASRQDTFCNQLLWFWQSAWKSFEDYLKNLIFSNELQTQYYTIIRLSRLQRIILWK